MPYTRPGVEAAVRLAKSVDDGDDNNNINIIDLWKDIEAKYNDMLVIKKKGAKELLDLDKQCKELGEKWRSMGISMKGDSDDDPAGNSTSEKEVYITREELYTVMKWKFSKGKSRPLWNYLKSNSEESVQKCSKASFVHVTGENSNISEALKEMSKLKGVGPAGSSAILSLYRPDLFVFMDDEVIECLYEGKREYSLKIYLEINQKCKEIVSTLGEEWNIRRVGKALWTAATISAYSDEEDLTLLQSHATENKKSSNTNGTTLAAEEDGKSRKSKRRKL